MDVRAYKLATPIQTRLPGAGVAIWLRPLPPADLQAAAMAAAYSPPITRTLRMLAEVCSRAITPAATADELMAALAPKDLVLLAMDQARAQEHGEVADHDRLKAWMRRSINDHPEVIDDGIAAYAADGPADFYGMPVARLTQAQLTYHMLLTSAFDEFYCRKEKVNYSKRRLAKDREERLQWQIQD